jgi:hypothetical protein
MVREGAEAVTNDGGRFSECNRRASSECIAPIVSESEDFPTPAQGPLSPSDQRVRHARDHIALRPEFANHHVTNRMLWSGPALLTKALSFGAIAPMERPRAA